MSKPETNHNIDSTLNNQELEMVVGGASAFLKGKVVAQLSPNYEVAEFQGGRGGPGNFAAKSLTTLGCWEACTYQISTC